MTPPTAAALAELSVEEASKAWLLYFVWLFGTDREPQGGPVKFSKEETRALEDFFARNRKYLESLGDQIPLAFRDHRPKLRFLRFLVDYINELTPILQSKKEYIAQLSEIVVGPVFNARKLMDSNLAGPVDRVLEGFRRRGLASLSELKERALYVNLSKSNEFVSPDLNLPVVPLLQALSVRLIIGLKTELLAFTG